MFPEEPTEPVIESYDAGSREAVGKARRKEKRKKNVRTDVVKAIMEQPEGRAFMYDYLNRCSTFTTPFVPGQPDTTAFNAGRQSIGHLIQEDIMLAAPETYWLMVREAASK